MSMMRSKKGDSKVEGCLNPKDRGKRRRSFLRAAFRAARSSSGGRRRRQERPSSPNAAGSAGRHRRQGDVDRSTPTSSSFAPSAAKRTRVGREAGELDGHETKPALASKCGHKVLRSGI
ncbi:MAG: 50S ribosomal protein L24 [Collinsella sp.]